MLVFFVLYAVDDLEQLDALLEKAGTNMVILMMTSRVS